MSAEAVKETTEPDDLNVGLIATVAIVGALLVIAIAAALTALVRSESASFGTHIGAYANLGAVQRLKAEQRAKLEAPPAWVDRAKGRVALPIDRAMQLVEGEIQRNPYLATLSPPATNEPAPAGSSSLAPGAETGAAAVPSGNRAAEGKALDRKEKEKADLRLRRPGPPDTKGDKVEPPKGAPVTPAAAPAGPR